MHWIIGLAPEFRVLLDTGPYAFDNVEVARDIDGDGDWEFSFSTTTFNYFGAGYAFSPGVYAWFKYDRKAGQFFPANHACFAEIKRQIRADEVKLRGRAWEKDPAPDHQELRQVVLDIVLAYLYAGHDGQAWSFFEREYHEDDGKELRRNVQRRAGTDPFFQALRARSGKHY